VNEVSPHAPRLVGDLMAREAIMVCADDPLSAAARLMDRHGVSGLPVIDAAGALVGVISETDLLRARATEYLWANWSGLRVKHLMTTPALAIRRDESLIVAARKLERHRVSRLVVVADEDETHPIGILAASDLVRAMCDIPGGEPAIDEPPGERVVAPSLMVVDDPDDDRHP